MADYFINRYQVMTGDSPEDILDFRLRPCLRVNTLKTTDEAIVERLEAKGVELEKVPFLPHAYWYKAPFSLGATEEYLLGLYYLQEAASQVPVNVLQDLLGDRLKESVILDMASAPGSKTTQLAAAMDNEGTIVALEADPRRGQALANNLERCGATNTQAFVKDSIHAADLGLVFDAAMLDAPCSGNMVVEKKWLDKRRMHDPKGRSELQKRLLRSGLDLLKPGGIMIYSTCSLEPEEDEGVLTAVLKDGERLIDTGLSIGDPGVIELAHMRFREDCVLARRLWPHRTGTQGFFIAAIRKD